MTTRQQANTSQSSKPVVILGAGGHARVLISLLKIIEHPILALLDDDHTKHNTALADVPITAGFDTLKNFNPDQVELVNALGSIHRPTARQALYERMTAQGYTFATIIHPAAVIAPEAKIEQGAQVMACATIQAGATLKSNCLINTGAIIDHDTTIDEHTHVAPGVTICGNVTIGSGCHVGAGATVVQGVAIGASTVVGAGATVLSDLPNDTTVVGTPAKPIHD